MPIDADCFAAGTGTVNISNDFNPYYSMKCFVWSCKVHMPLLTHFMRYTIRATLRQAAHSARHAVKRSCIGIYMLRDTYYYTVELITHVKSFTQLRKLCSRLTTYRSSTLLAFNSQIMHSHRIVVVS